MERQRRQRLTLAATILGSAIVFLDSTVVNVALPALQRDLDAGLAAQQWVVEAYLLSLVALLLLGGSLGDRLGRRRVFVAGSLAFGATSLLAAVAPTSGWLVAARALQGGAGALLVPGSLAIITAAFGREERGRAVGTWTAGTGVAIVFGPMLGGMLIDLLSWRWIFAINVPLVAATVAIALHAVEETSDPEHSRTVDWPGAALAAAALGGPVFALIEQPSAGWSSPLVGPPLAAGAALLVAFLVRESRTPAPMLPLGLFRNRDFSATNGATLGVYAGLGGSMFLLSLFLQQVGGYTPFEAGLALTPVTVILFFCSRWAGGLSDRVGPRLPMTAGPLVAAAGLLLALRLDGTPDYAAEVLPALVVFGLGLALTVTPLTTTILNSVPERHAGIASGVNNAVARAATLVAIAVLGAAVSGRFSTTLDDRLAGRSLDARAERAVADARARPLASARDEDGVPAGLERPIEAAAVSGFRTGMGLAALLVAAGGVVAAAGVRRRVDDASFG